MNGIPLVLIFMNDTIHKFPRNKSKVLDVPFFMNDTPKTFDLLRGNL